MDPKTLIIMSIILVVFAFSQSYDANKHIKKLNEENSERYWIPRLQEAPVFLLVLVFVLLVVVYFKI